MRALYQDSMRASKKHLSGIHQFGTLCICCLAMYTARTPKAIRAWRSHVAITKLKITVRTQDLTTNVSYATAEPVKKKRAGALNINGISSTLKETQANPDMFCVAVYSAV